MKSIMNLLMEEDALVADYNRAMSAIDIYEREAAHIQKEYPQSCTRDADVADYMCKARHYRGEAVSLHFEISKKRKEIAKAINDGGEKIE